MHESLLLLSLSVLVMRAIYFLQDALWIFVLIYALSVCCLLDQRIFSYDHNGFFYALLCWATEDYILTPISRGCSADVTHTSHYCCTAILSFSPCTLASTAAACVHHAPFSYFVTCYGPFPFMLKKRTDSVTITDSHVCATT